MSKRQIIIASITLLVCTNFLVANTCWLWFFQEGWIKEQSTAENWYFKSLSFVFPALFLLIRELCKRVNLFFFVAFDFLLNLSLLGFLAEWLTDNTKYHPTQLHCSFISLLISIWHFFRMKKKT